MPGVNLNWNTGVLTDAFSGLRQSFQKNVEIVQLEYLELTVCRREVGEVLVVAGRAPAC
jgi:hypothetical protein